MKEHYSRVDALDLMNRYIKILRHNGSNPQLNYIQEALADHNIFVEFPEEEIAETTPDPQGKYKCYSVTVLFIKKDLICREERNVLVKLPIISGLLETKMLTLRDHAFLKKYKVIWGEDRI